MQNPFSSPYATRKLSIAIAWAVVTLVFGVIWMWPYDTPNERPGVVAKICVLIVFSSAYLWKAFGSWKAWLLDYEFGVRLSKLNQSNKAIDTVATDIEDGNLESATESLSLVPQPVREKLRFPWASLICCILLFVYIFQWNGLTPLWLGVILCLMIYVYRPLNRWMMCYSETQTYEAIEAEENSFLPLDKHLIHVDDSNFYRFHKNRLLDLGFRPIGRELDRHFFTNSSGNLIAILGRKSRYQVYNYFSLITIDNQGCIFQSDSFDAENLDKVAACHELWEYQTLNMEDIATALDRHNEYATSGAADQRFVSLSCHSVSAKYIHDVTSNARVKHYNKHRIAFA